MICPRNIYFCILRSSQIKLDKIVDHFLPKIRNYILKNGMDPMDLVDFSENIFPHMVRFSYIKYCLFFN
jgi:hypothetical protein